MPRPRHKPTPELRQQVMMYAGLGMPHRMIAKKLGFSYDTLAKYYRVELDNGEFDANASAAQALLNKATGRPAVYDTRRVEQPDGSYQNETVLIRAEIKPDTTAAIFWLKARAGWIESERLQLAGPDNEPLQIAQQFVIEVVGEDGRVKQRKE